MTNRTVIVGYMRSPFTPARKGELVSVRPDDLAAHVIAALVMQTAINPADIEDLLVGCAFPEGEQGFNVARMISLIAGLPLSWVQPPSTAVADRPDLRSRCCGSDCYGRWRGLHLCGR